MNMSSNGHLYRLLIYMVIYKFPTDLINNKVFLNLTLKENWIFPNDVYAHNPTLTIIVL